LGGRYRILLKHGDQGDFVASREIAIVAIRYPYAKLSTLRDPTLIVCPMSSGNVIVFEDHLSNGGPTPSRAFLKHRRNM
jgi:hypothetical protein